MLVRESSANNFNHCALHKTHAFEVISALFSWDGISFASDRSLPLIHSKTQFYQTRSIPNKPNRRSRLLNSSANPTSRVLLIEIGMEGKWSMCSEPFQVEEACHRMFPRRGFCNLFLFSLSTLIPLPYNNNDSAALSVMLLPFKMISTGTRTDGSIHQ